MHFAQSSPAYETDVRRAAVSTRPLVLLNICELPRRSPGCAELHVPLWVVVCNAGISIDPHLLRWRINTLQAEQAAAVEGEEFAVGVWI